MVSWMEDRMLVRMESSNSFLTASPTSFLWTAFWRRSSTLTTSLLSLRWMSSLSDDEGSGRVSGVVRP